MRHVDVTKAAIFIFATMLLTPVASAAFLNNDGTPAGETTPLGAQPFTQWNRSSGNSVYAEWDVFRDPVGDPQSPDVAGSFPSDGSLAGGLNGASAILQLSLGAADSFLVGGNIYSPTAITAFDVAVPGYGNGATWNTRVALQFRTRGTGVDFPAMELRYDNGGTQTLTWGDRVYDEQLSSIALGGFGGFQVESLVVFDIVGFNPGSLTLAFASPESSMSFAGLAVDVYATQSALAPVPEPSSFVLFALGLLGLQSFRRRR